MALPTVTALSSAHTSSVLGPLEGCFDNMSDISHHFSLLARAQRCSRMTSRLASGSFYGGEGLTSFTTQPVCLQQTLWDWMLQACDTPLGVSHK